MKLSKYKNLLPHKSSKILAKFFFQARCTMLDVKTNFKNRFVDLLCPLGCNENMEDTQQHLLVCEKLRDSSMVLKIPEYDEIFDQDVTKIVNVASILRSKLSTRQKMLNNVVWYHWYVVQVNQNSTVFCSIIIYILIGINVCMYQSMYHNNFFSSTT